MNNQIRIEKDIQMGNAHSDKCLLPFARENINTSYFPLF